MLISFEKEEEIIEMWKGLVFFPKQANKSSIDLTINKIFSVESQGVLDFGGSEYRQSEKVLIQPVIADDPNYGWWTLERGEYIIEYNEILMNENCVAIVFPHQRLQETGCYHSPFVVNPTKSEDIQSLSSLLVVSTNGIRIKENARVSSAVTFDLSS
jgi:deoxycytidine triphosphate deaminase